MIKKLLAKDRHFADHGWLKTFWLFSFSDYYDPSNIHHGVLRVFNDDIVEAGQGFGMHPHKDMEIITIILKGEISHKDSMGNEKNIKRGEIQRISAGTGVYHSEFNDGSEDLHLYQIWILPDKQGIQPSYEQKSFDPAKSKNSLLPVVNPQHIDGAISINQDASIYLSDLEKGNSVTHTTDAARKLFVYVTKGDISINGETFAQNDQARISEEGTLKIDANEDAEFMLIDCVAH